MDRFGVPKSNWVKIQLESMCLQNTEPTEGELLMLATATKRQRTEVKLSTLDSSERKEFEEAKAKEVQNWLETGTVVRVPTWVVPQANP